MILIAHILIALSGMLVTGLTYLVPTKTKLQASYALLAGTLASGTFLVVSSNASLMRACISGLVYTAVVMAGIFAAQRKLATEHTS